MEKEENEDEGWSSIERGAPAASKSRYLRPLSVTAVKRGPLVVAFNWLASYATLFLASRIVSPLAAAARGKRGVARDRLDFAEIISNVYHLNGESSATIKRLNARVN